MFYVWWSYLQQFSSTFQHFYSSYPSAIAQLHLQIYRWSTNTSDMHIIICCMFVMICAITAGYSVASSFRILRSKPFTVLDYLIAVSLIGRFGRFLLFFLIHLHTTSNVGNSFKAMYILHAVLITLECFYQLPFCLFAVRVVIIGLDVNHGRRALVFKAVLIHLAVCNVMMWIAGILEWVCKSYSLYFAIKNQQNAFLDRFLQPLSLFYRFGCFLLITKALRKAFNSRRMSAITKDSDVVDMPKWLKHSWLVVFILGASSRRLRFCQEFVLQ